MHDRTAVAPETDRRGGVVAAKADVDERRELIDGRRPSALARTRRRDAELKSAENLLSNVLHKSDASGDMLCA